MTMGTRDTSRGLVPSVTRDGLKDGQSSDDTNELRPLTALGPVKIRLVFTCRVSKPGFIVLVCPLEVE